MDTDALIYSMAGCGLFQGLQYIAIDSSYFLAAFQLSFMAFGNYNPGWTCGDSLGTSNMMDSSAFGNGSEIIKAITTHKYDVAGNLVMNSTVSQNTNDTLRDLCNQIETCNQFKFSDEASTIVSEFNLVCDDSWITSLMISVQMVGGAVGAVITGQLSGLQGRKFSLYSFVVIGTVFNAIAIFSVSWEMFLTVRFFLGISFGGIIATAIPFYMEYLNTWWRPVVGSIPMWNVAVASFAVCAWILKDWRQIHIATTVVGVLCFLPAFWVPESLRWLAVNGKVTQAKKVASKICKTNGKPEPDTNFIEEIAKNEKANNQNKAKYTYLHLFRNSQLIKGTIIFPLTWMTIALSFYGIYFGIKSLSGNFYLNLFIGSSITIPPKLFLPWIMLRFGRKWPNIFMLLIAGTLCFTVVLAYFVTSGATRDTLITSCALASVAFLESCWTISYPFICETFPTVLRSEGFSIAVVGARIGSVLAPYLIPKDFETLYINFIVMGSLLLTCSGLVCLLPDTRDKPLQDSIQLESMMSEDQSSASLNPKSERKNPVTCA